MQRPHLQCWDAREECYQHICQEPTGRPCIEEGCEEPAGTWWTKFWCTDCDVLRQQKISDALDEIQRSLLGLDTPTLGEVQ